MDVYDYRYVLLSAKIIVDPAASCWRCFKIPLLIELDEEDFKTR